MLNPVITFPLSNDIEYYNTKGTKNKRYLYSCLFSRGRETQYVLYWSFFKKKKDTERERESDILFPRIFIAPLYIRPKATLT